MLLLNYKPLRNRTDELTPYRPHDYWRQAEYINKNGTPDEVEKITKHLTWEENQDVWHKGIKHVKKLHFFNILIPILYI